MIFDKLLRLFLIAILVGIMARAISYVIIFAKKLWGVVVGNWKKLDLYEKFLTVACSAVVLASIWRVVF